MKKHLNYWLALALLLPALHACQDDQTLPDTTGTPTVVRASIGNPGSRAQVQYGTQNAADGELFLWNAGDQFKAYNITAAEATPTAYAFNISNYNEAQPGNQADFSCANGFSATPGNKIAAFYGNGITNATAVTGANGEKGIQVTLTTPTTLTQTQTATPGNADLKHLQQGLCMYALTEAGENGSISPLSFRHLSALFRITIRNQKSDEAKIKYAIIQFPMNENIICKKKKVTVWEDNTVDYEVDESDKRYSRGNYLNNTNGQSFATIAPGSSYDCFIPAMPVAEEGNTASSIKIGVEFDGDNIAKFLTIDGFTNVEIKAGMRYWFDLTVKADGTLVQSFQTDYAWYTSNRDATEFSISTPGELYALARLVNGDAEALTAAGVSDPVAFQGKTIRLAGNIDLGNEPWTPIGNSNQPFEGTFDGGGHHLSGLKTVDNGTNENAGLFGFILGGTVRNLRVSGTVKTTKTSAGGIAGQLFMNCTVENCIFSGSVSGPGNVGGIVGYSYVDNRIAGCYTKGTVTATSDKAGGIVGENNAANIDRCYSEATVTATSHVGGIVGSNSNGKVTKSYATGAISAKKEAGGIAGMNGTVTGCIALHPSLTRTEGSETSFGRIVSNEHNTTLTNCAAFAGMTLPSGIQVTSAADGIHGADLTAAACLNGTTYTDRGITPDSDWTFDDTNTPWKYLPWNKAFESWNIPAEEYRIAVPQHIKNAFVD